MLIESGADVHAKTKDSWWTPGHMAASNGKRNCLELLIKAGIDVNAKAGPRLTSTLLHEASHCGFVDCIELLLDSGADATLYDNKDLAIHTVCRLGYSDCLELLLKHYQSINRADLMNAYTNVDKQEDRIHYLTALHMAAVSNQTECVQMLLKYNCKHLPTGLGHYPLVLASLKMNIDCLRVLLKSDNDTKHSSNTAFTPLHFLCTKTYKTTEKCVAVACLLLNWGVDINHCNPHISNWETCLSISSRNGAMGLVNFLLESGANPHMSDDLDKRSKNFPNVRRCWDAIQDARDAPQSLRIQCRKAVRKWLGVGKIHKIYDMELPRVIQNYVFHGHFLRGNMCDPL